MKQFRICPACGYKRGFHVYLIQDDRGGRLGLICPSCGASYDPGLEPKNIGSFHPPRGEDF